MPEQPPKNAATRRSGWREITDHLAAPGPDYWSWRCLICSEPAARGHDMQTVPAVQVPQNATQWLG